MDPTNRTYTQPPLRTSFRKARIAIVKLVFCLLVVMTILILLIQVRRANRALDQSREILKLAQQRIDALEERLAAQMTAPPSPTSEPLRYEYHMAEWAMSGGKPELARSWLQRAAKGGGLPSLNYALDSGYFHSVKDEPWFTGLSWSPEKDASPAPAPPVQ